MCNVLKRMRIASFLLLICTLLVPWSGVSCCSSFIGGRKVLGSIASSTSQINFEQTLSTPRSVCRTTGNCKEVLSASKMPPSFHRSLSASPVEETCLDSLRPILLAERHLIPPFVDLPCFDETKAQPKDINDTRKELQTLTKNDDAAVIKEWLACSTFDINGTDSQHETLLHYAAYNNARNTAQLLCNASIDTEVKNADGKTALIVAAEHRCVDALRAIVDCNANVSAKDKQNKTALHYSAFKDSSEIAQVLCNASIDTEVKNKAGRTALVVAAQQGSLKALRAIIDSCTKVNVNASDKANKTALHYAATNNSSRMAQVLCDAHINIEIRNKGNRTVLVNAAYNNILEPLKVIVNRCANVNLDAQDSAKRTALHYAGINHNCEMAEFLVKKGANYSIVDKGNHTAECWIPSLSVIFQKNTTDQLHCDFRSCGNQTAGEAT